MANKAGRGTYSIEVEPYELKNLLQLLGSLPAETQQVIRDKAQPLSKRLAGQLTMSAMSASAPQTRLLIQSFSTPRDRLIRVDIGGAKKVGRKYGGTTSKNGKTKVKQSSASAGELLWGTEYGSHKGIDRAGRVYSDRFKVPYNKMGYWIRPAVDNYVPIIAREYTAMVQGVVNDLGFK